MAESIELSEKLISGLLVPADGQATVPAFDGWLFSILGQGISEHLGEIILFIGFTFGVVVLIWVDSLIKFDKEKSSSSTSRLSFLNSDKFPAGFSVAFIIALGIGLHNLGEGLVVGVSLGTGNTTLATALIFGFAIHNVTEGVAITGPVSDARVGVAILIILGLVAGAPTIVGSWIGLIIFSNAIAVFFFSIAAGSLLFVIINITAAIGKNFNQSNWNYVAVLLGIFVMYFTSLFIII